MQEEKEINKLVQEYDEWKKDKKIEKIQRKINVTRIQYRADITPGEESDR